ncbi:MAG: hydrogenase maturation protease [Desulfobacterales bacterium]|nr:hydrogenase maturation protease [Desulfobacterales bacterium]
MGNPILSDDGVGIWITEQLKPILKNATVKSTTMVGLHLLDMLAGYFYLFIIDACTTGLNPVGTIVKLTDGNGCRHLFSSHGMNFFTLINMGKQMGLIMPEIIHIYGIEIGREVGFGIEFSLEIQKKLPQILEDLQTATNKVHNFNKCVI